MTDVTDQQPEPSDLRVFDRLVAAGLSIERVEEHLTAGRVRVDGERVTDPYLPVPPNARIVLALD
jgi:S4 domain